eukprot:3569044-Amphidinium_carterae.2
MSALRHQHMFRAESVRDRSKLAQGSPAVADFKGLDTPAKVIHYGDGVKDLISPSAKERFGSYKNGQDWERPHEDVQWSLSFIRDINESEQTEHVRAGSVTRISHNAFTNDPPVSSEIKPLLRGFLSQPFDLDEPIPAPSAAPSASSSTVGVEIEMEPSEKVTWKRPLRSMSMSDIIDLDGPSPKRQNTDMVSDPDAISLTTEDEMVAMAAEDTNVQTLSQELEQLLNGDAEATTELQQIAAEGKASF